MVLAIEMIGPPVAFQSGDDPKERGLAQPDGPGLLRRMPRSKLRRMESGGLDLGRSASSRLDLEKAMS
jgi:hypothetical protein